MPACSYRFSVSPATLENAGMEQKTPPTQLKTRRGWQLQQAPLTPILVSVKDGAALLGVCSRTVQNLIAAKKLKVRKVGRRTLLSYRELLTFAQHDHSTTALGQQ